MSQSFTNVDPEDVEGDQSSYIRTQTTPAHQAPEDTSISFGEYSDFPAEAAAFVQQFPGGQFIPGHTFNLQGQNELLSQSQPTTHFALPLPSQLLERFAQTSSATQQRLHAAQWNVQPLNPLIPDFKDPELDRETSGSSVLDESSIVGESGRTYHGYKAGLTSYLLPNDAAEQDRLDFQHAMMAHLWEGRLVLAPLPRAPEFVLDVATGTGIWALEFARANPTSLVVGTDLSKIQPNPDVPNCLFERVDCEEEWLYTYNFDYIHIRMIIAAIHDPKRLLRQVFDNLSPGGWIELQDADMDLLSEEGPERDERVATSYLKRYFDLLALGASSHGIDLHKSQYYKNWLIEAGFVDVVEEKFHVACAPWPKDKKAQIVGQWMRVNYLSGLRGVGYKSMRSAGMAPEAIEKFIAATRDEVKHGNIRGYTPWYAVYGRKPFEWESRQPGYPF